VGKLKFKNPRCKAIDGQMILVSG